jgi:glycosyltransferase involved in cell wall biosynthesis
MAKFPYTAVHAHTMFSIGWVMLAAKQMKIPVRVSHAHSALIDGNSLVKSVYEKFMRMLILTCSTDLVACGEKAGIRLYGKKAYKKHGNLILNGIDTKAFAFSQIKRDEIRTEFNINDKFVLGHTGRLAEVKNQAFILGLMPEILKKKNNAVLMLIGDGEDRKTLEDTAKELGVSDKVIFVGNVTNVQDYLSAMDIFVFPSLYEGLPLSILEVQANGLPCIISDTVPPDVFLTELIHPLSLKEPEDKWINEILSVERNFNKDYSDELKASGFDLETAMKKVYAIYEN